MEPWPQPRSTARDRRSPGLRGLVRARNGTVGTGNEAARDPGRRLCSPTAAARSHLLRPRRAAPARRSGCESPPTMRAVREGRRGRALCSASRAAREPRAVGAARTPPRPCRAPLVSSFPGTAGVYVQSLTTAPAPPGTRAQFRGSTLKLGIAAAVLRAPGQAPERLARGRLLRSMLWHSDNAAARTPPRSGSRRLRRAAAPPVGTLLFAELGLDDTIMYGGYETRTPGPDPRPRSRASRRSLGKHTTASDLAERWRGGLARRRGRAARRARPRRVSRGRPLSPLPAAHVRDPGKLDRFLGGGQAGVWCCTRPVGWPRRGTTRAGLLAGRRLRPLCSRTAGSARLGRARRAWRSALKRFAAANPAQASGFGTAARAPAAAGSTLRHVAASTGRVIVSPRGTWSLRRPGSSEPSSA